MKKFFSLFLFVLLLSACGSQDSSSAPVHTSNQPVVTTQDSDLIARQTEIHNQNTNFPVLDLHASYKYTLPSGTSFSGNTIITKEQDTVPLLPQNGIGKLANSPIKFEGKLDDAQDAKDEFYSIAFNSFYRTLYYTQLAYHMDVGPGVTDVLDVEVHFPAFFTLSDSEKEEFFTKIAEYKKLYKDIRWRMITDTKTIDTEELQNFFDSFYDMNTK